MPSPPSRIEPEAGTGRLREGLDWRARRIVFGDRSDRAIDEELPHYLQIDRAHVVMLVERDLLPRDQARRILTAIDTLIAQDYAPLRDLAAPRGLYLLYERWLIETLGEATGGVVHLGRSRNDMNATVLHLRLRSAYGDLVRELLRLLVIVIGRSERYASVTMPIYTHYQVALPVTYGHYLAGIALALLRDLQGLEDAVRELDRSPLGAGAAGGTTVPIDPERTAQLLGFRAAVQHSLDAVASRDLVLRLLAAMTILGVTLSRLAADLQLWSTSEFDLIEFPDTLVGSSSMMPQKRNAFLLEHVKGQGGAPLGAFTAAVMAMHATPFTNSIAVGTEGVKPLWPALRELTKTTILVRLAVAGARPRPERMRRRAVEGFAAATELANRLVLDTGLSFRQAHRQVGERVRTAIDRGEPLTVADWAEPSAIAAGAAFGGGPAASCIRQLLASLRVRISLAGHALDERRRGWRAAQLDLDAAVAALITCVTQHP